MTSAMLINEEAKNMTKYKDKFVDDYYLDQLQTHPKLNRPNADEKPSILNFSRENLNISQSNMEHRFTKHSLIRWHIINRHTIINICTIVLAVSCILFEIYKLPKVLENSRDIEILKRDLEALQQQFYEENILNEFKAFEEQLYGGDIDDTWSDDDVIGENENDDNYYDDDDDDDDDGEADSPDGIDVRPSDSHISSTISPVSNKDLGPVLNDIEKEEAGHDKDIDSTVPKNKTNNTEQGLSSDFSKVRRKRYTNDDDASIKFIHDDEITHKHLKSPTESTAKMVDVVKVGGGKRRRYRKVSDETKKPLVTRVPSKHNFHVARQIFAAHYGADSSLFANEDEHTGNGKLRHNEGIFKAWRPSDWMNDFGMDRHFSLNNDGKLTVHETGLYLVYAQIHYLDEHDENGFHLLVNGRPILQCMVYSPGTSHKSRSCFSAQIILLQNDDRIVLKDVGVSRYTLFQKDKSFFGLVKIGDMKHPILHRSQNSEND